MHSIYRQYNVLYVVIVQEKCVEFSFLERGQFKRFVIDFNVNYKERWGDKNQQDCHLTVSRGLILEKVK